MVLLERTHSPSSCLQARDGNSVCVAMSGGGQHGEGKYIVLNVQEGGKVRIVANTGLLSCSSKHAA